MNAMRVAAGVAFSFVVAGAAFAAGVDGKRIRNADREPGQWLSVGRTYDEQRYSPLAQITTDNVGKLGLAWHADFDTNRGQEATPLVIDGRLFVTTAWSKVRAYDARTGAPLWSYDPKVPPEWGIRGCCDVVNRGLAAWGNNVYVGTYDGRLVALDQQTGKVVFDVTTIDRNKYYSITGAPRIVNGKVIVGNGGAEIGVRGYIGAYDAKDGHQLWRFHTVPGDPSQPQENAALTKAVATWKGDQWILLGGGGTVWDGMAYDVQSNLLYFGTANGTPWVAETRSPGGGDNLYLNSIIAINPDNGAYAWHYQVIPEETWDFDATSPLMVADLKLEGRKRRVVMQASKNGFFYVLDAKSGKLLSAKNFTTVTWASGIDLKTGRPIANPEARYDRTGKPVIMQPGAQGAHSWHPMAFSPRTGLVYTPVIDGSSAFLRDPKYTMKPNTGNGGTGAAPPTIYEDLHSPAPRGSDAQLVAWDPARQQEVWRVKGLGRVGSGALATAGGPRVRRLAERRALRVPRRRRPARMDGEDQRRRGRRAHDIRARRVQYVAQVAGYGSRDYYSSNESRLLVYKLGGNAPMPAPAPLPPTRVLAPPEQFGLGGGHRQRQVAFLAELRHVPRHAVRQPWPLPRPALLADDQHRGSVQGRGHRRHSHQQGHGVFQGQDQRAGCGCDSRVHDAARAPGARRAARCSSCREVGQLSGRTAQPCAGRGFNSRASRRRPSTSLRRRRSGACSRASPASAFRCRPAR